MTNKFNGNHTSPLIRNAFAPFPLNKKALFMKK